ncbi:MAG: helix-hairpin-helix domain-containing protein [Promethearchaeota archaeon]
MEIIRLNQIPGVGDKVAKSLIAHFGSQEEALGAIADAKVTDIAAAPGMSVGKALGIVKKAYELREGVSPEDVLKTQDVRDIYEHILRILKTYTQTNYAKYRLNLYFPLPSEKFNVIKERLSYFDEAKNLVDSLDDMQIKRIRELLSRLKPLRKGLIRSRITDRIILTNSPEIYERLRTQKVNSYCSVFLIEATKGRESLMEYINTYENIIFIAGGEYYESVLDEADNVQVVSPETPIEDIIPERTIVFFSTNYDVIKASCELGRVFRDFPENPVINKFKNQLDLERLEEVGSIIDTITKDGEIAKGYNKELDRYRYALENFDKTIGEAEAWLNGQIRNSVAESSISIRGEQIIRILETSATDTVEAGRLRQYLPPEVIEIFSEAVQKAGDMISKNLNLSPEETILVDGIFPQTIGLPIETISKRVGDLENSIRMKYSQKQLILMREITNTLLKHISTVQAAVQSLLEFDIFLAVGLFSQDYGLNPPNVDREHIGIGFKEGKNIFLREKELRGGMKVIPIDYVLGNVPYRPPNTNGESVIILTGANSGGKSMCVELVNQIAILAHMGFPVPAQEAYIGLFNELYFFAKSRGMVSAGALETTLKNFSKIVISSASKLVLFDEVEAITESGAAAKIIAGILDVFSRNENACAVLVSHLAEQIVKLLSSSIRVDGIEAKGLDEDLNLIVDRSPRFNYLAKSTPELIVERLYRLSKNEEREIYYRILRDFKEVESKETN